MYTWLNKQGVQSDRGFMVQSVDRFTVEYREGVRKVSVEVENGMLGGKPCVSIYPAAFERWDGDPEWMIIPPETQDDMLAKFTDAMEFMGVAVVVEPAE